MRPEELGPERPMEEPFILAVTWVRRLHTGTMKDAFRGDVTRMVALPQCNAHSPRSSQP